MPIILKPRVYRLNRMTWVCQTGQQQYLTSTWIRARDHALMVAAAQARVARN